MHLVSKASQLKMMNQKKDIKANGNGKQNWHVNVSILNSYANFQVEESEKKNILLNDILIKQNGFAIFNSK